jgi:hypothetical protein
MRTLIIPALLACSAVGASALDYNIRVDIDGTKNDIHFSDFAPVSTKGVVTKATWLATEKADAHLCGQFATPVGTWTEVAFRATPSADGQIALSLMGPWQRKPNQETVADDKKEIEEIRVSWDLVSVDGATVANGDFEQANASGAEGWWFNKGAERMTGENLAKSGKAWISTWHNGNAVQLITVSAGKPFTIRGWVQSTYPATK